MTGAIILDSGPLGMVTNPKGGPESVRCKAWLQSLLDADRRVILPGIADYEVRRELVLVNKINSLSRLDEFRTGLEFLEVKQVHLTLAAGLWANVRLAGLPTADRHSLDADCILAAQVLSLGDSNSVIATLNVSHLSRFTPAALWWDID